MEKGRQLSLLNELGVGNALYIDQKALSDNMHAVQKRNRLPLTESASEMQFCVEMETGTGKTYVYPKTIFELNRKYGFTKFIIVQEILEYTDFANLLLPERLEAGGSAAAETSSPKKAVSSSQQVILDGPALRAFFGQIWTLDDLQSFSYQAIQYALLNGFAPYTEGAPEM